MSPYAVHAVDGLRLNGALPPWVTLVTLAGRWGFPAHQEHIACGRQVQTHCARLERDEHDDRVSRAVGFRDGRLELGDDRLAL